MAGNNFSLDEYETVEQRIKRFYEDHPDGRIITKDITTKQDRSTGVWRIKATIYFDREELVARTPKATGLAFEVDGQGMTQKASALETGETSAIGRALANAGYSGNKRASREEMTKAERQGDTRNAQARNAEARRVPTPAQAAQALKMAKDPKLVTSIELGRKHYQRLAAMGAKSDVLDDLANFYATLPSVPEDDQLSIPGIDA